MTLETELRNANLQDDLFPMLGKLHEAKLDAVVPIANIRSEGAVLQVKGISVFGEQAIRPTAIMDGQIAGVLDIPVKYVRRMRAERPDLYDLNFNGWVQGNADLDAAGMEKRYLLRTFVEPGGGEGIGRAILSDRYGPIEHLDVLTAAIVGISESGAECEVVRANLSETRMSVRFAAPGIAALAPELLKGYKASVPGWGSIDRIRELANREGQGYKPGEEPIVFAGFDLDNSETGGGAFNVSPVITVKICGNGLKLDVMGKLRRIHLGAKLDEGEIKWSEATQEKQLALVASQTKDAIAAFLDIDFLQKQINAIEEKAGAPIKDAVKTVELIAKTLNYTADEQALIMAHFIQGSQMTAGGILNAVTSAAQVVENPDEAYDLEGTAMQAFELAFAGAS